MSFSSVRALLDACKAEGRPLYEVILRSDLAESGLTEAESRATMRRAILSTCLRSSTLPPIEYFYSVCCVQSLNRLEIDSMAGTSESERCKADTRWRPHAVPSSAHFSRHGSAGTFSFASGRQLESIIRRREPCIHGAQPRPTGKQTSDANRPLARARWEKPPLRSWRHE